MPNNSKYDVNDLLASVINQQPIEFDEIFKDIMVDRIQNVLVDRKQEIAQSIFDNSPRDTNNSEE